MYVVCLYVLPCMCVFQVSLDCIGGELSLFLSPLVESQHVCVASPVTWR